jgi:hypothetical protein
MVRKEARPSSIMAPVFAFPRGLEQLGVSPMPQRSPAPKMSQPPKLRTVAPLPEPAQAPPPRPRNAAATTEPPPADPGKPRRLMVSVTPGEFETLGIIAVKKNVTRHQLVRNALNEYLALLVEEFGEGCQCIYTGCSCGKAK